MSFVNRIAGAAFGVALLTGSGLISSPVQAGYVVTLQEVGGNVIAEGEGPLDLTGLTLVGQTTISSNTPFNFANVFPQLGFIVTAAGQSTFFTFDNYSGGITGPTSFGIGGHTPADSGSGDIVGIFGAFPTLFIPHLYMSNNPLSNTSTYAGETFLSLGVTPGTYVWEWGDGGANQNFTLIIGPTAVPEPASVALLGAALAGLGLAGTVRRKQN